MIGCFRSLSPPMFYSVHDFWYISEIVLVLYQIDPQLQLLPRKVARKLSSSQNSFPDLVRFSQCDAVLLGEIKTDDLFRIKQEFIGFSGSSYNWRFRRIKWKQLISPDQVETHSFSSFSPRIFSSVGRLRNRWRHPALALHSPGRRTSRSDSSSSQKNR